MRKWEQQAAPLKGIAVVEHHKNMEYLLNWLGMHSVGTLEPKPGVEPSAAHLSQLVAQLQNQPAKMVLRAAYQDSRASEWLAEHAHVPAVMLPFTVGGDDKAKDLFGLFDDTVQRLLEGAK
jgi:zinc/manganese transport system substrate-binding protein